MPVQEGKGTLFSDNREEHPSELTQCCQNKDPRLSMMKCVLEGFGQVP